MIWIVLAISVGFWLLARVERAAVARIRTQITDAEARLAVEVQRAKLLRDLPPAAPIRCVVLPAPFPLAARATTDCQGACALYSWMTSRGGKA